MNCAISRTTRVSATLVVLVAVGCATGSCGTRRDRPIQRPSPVPSIKFESPAKKVHDGLDGLVSKITERMTDAEKNRVAVVDFCDLDRRVSRLGKFLAEEVITRLFETGRFQVIERGLLYKVAEEQNLTLDPMLDPAAAQQLGRILGVEAIVTGTITDLVDTYRLNARMIGTEQGRVFAAASATLPKDQALRSLNYE